MRKAALLHFAALAGLPALGSGEALAAQAVVYTIVDGSTTIVSSGPAEAETRPGGRPTTDVVAAPQQLSFEEQERLAATEAYFAPYDPDEIREGRRDKEGNFVPFGVFLPDNREVIVNTSEYPNSAVVSMTFDHAATGIRYGCTGAIISENLVLTAGHCVFDGGWHSNFVIYPGLNGAIAPFGPCRATQLVALTDWVNPAAGTDDRLQDFGAIRLDCAIGQETGVFGLRILDDAEPAPPAVIHGYPCDLAQGTKQYLSRDTLRDRLPLKLFYQNDTSGCMSGAPVFSGADFRIFAVHTNTFDNGAPWPWSSNNAGTRLTADRIGLLELLMSQLGR